MELGLFIHQRFIEHILCARYSVVNRTEGVPVPMQCINRKHINSQTWLFQGLVRVEKKMVS